MLITITLIIATIGFIYWFLTKNFDYWPKRGVLGPKPNVFTGNLPNSFTQKKHLIYDLDTLYRAYKSDEDFVGIFSARNPQLLILNPILCRRVLVNDFKHFHDNELSTMVDKNSDFLFGNNPFALTGEEWKERRALLTPGLTMGRVKTVYPVTNKICHTMTNYIKEQIKMAPKDGIEARDLCLRFTTEVVTDCVLGLSAQSFTEKPTPILGMIQKLFAPTFDLICFFLITSFFPNLRKWYKGRFLPKYVEKFFVDLMQNAIDQRKSQGNSERIDFMHYMLQLQEKKNLTTQDLTANTMTFLFDGYETTATSISHCLLLLARYPETQKRLRAEIMAHIDENGFIDFDTLAELPYLDACMHEAIRIFPPGFFANRICTEPIELTSKSGRTVHLQKGDGIMLPLYSFMLDEDYYAKAQEFHPERFLEENHSSVKEYRERGLYYGFSDGPRVCIGMRFALTQSKAALVEIIKNFNISCNPKTRKDNLFDPKSFLARLEGGIWLDFEVIK